MKDTLLGSQIAGYRVERVLGRGGMASVYFAWDTKNDRPVAFVHHFERNRAVVPGIPGEVNGSHPTAPKQALNAIPGDLAAD